MPQCQPQGQARELASMARQKTVICRKERGDLTTPWYKFYYHAWRSVSCTLESVLKFGKTSLRNILTYKPAPLRTLRMLADITSPLPGLLSLRLQESLFSADIGDSRPGSSMVKLIREPQKVEGKKNAAITSIFVCATANHRLT